ncbi:MAG: glycoside hydrolase family 2 TIM barrel-domain containing protein, partial [Bacteroidota bacterium]
MKKQSTLFLTLLLLTLAILLNVWSIKAQKTSTNNQETIIKYLSSTGKDHTVTWDFFCTKGRKSGAWSKIEVPSCWEQQGFGSYNYGHDPMDERADEEGLYKHQFELPDSWRNKTVRIVFEAAMTDTEVKINGELAGAIHQGAFYEFKYDITDKLEFGKPNLLEVKVSKVSANQSINFAERQADFWIFGGIFRPVYLEILPEEHIERIAIDAKANGNILADIFTKTSEGTVQLALLDLNGNKLRDLALSKAKYEDGKLHVETKANNIKTWNPEYPRLYQLQVSLLDENGRVTHKIKERIGFRTVEVLEGDGIYVNGQKIKFKGVNRHSFYPSSGRTTSKALSIAHIKMMKDMNMNAVRMSHYPPDKHFLEACDSLGLFVIDEVCTWHS